MTALSFHMAEISDSPGWNLDSGLPHDNFWKLLATGYHYSAASGADPVFDSKGDADPATGSSAGTFQSGFGSVDLTQVDFDDGTSLTSGSGGPVASLDWSADGQGAVLALETSWNAIKNVEVGKLNRPGFAGGSTF